MQSIAIIGAGPKAAAIAAKASSLSTFNTNVPSITIYERHQPAAAWVGKTGYTDGLQPLCTFAERDLGFPYSRLSFGQDVADDMFGRFSWQSFAVRDGLDRAQYDQWVLRGRNPPAHRDFAKYLNSAFALSGANMISREVTGLDFAPSAGQWSVSAFDVGLNRTVNLLYDGVVVTGSGPALAALPNGSGNPRIFDGISFWQRLQDVVGILDAENPDDRSVVIIGAGGTAAAIAYWFVRQKLDIPITILGRESTLFARHPGFFEDRLFSEEDEWADLADHSRDEFVARLTTGVVWDYVLKNLDSAQIKYSCSDVHRVSVLGGRHTGLYPEVVVDVQQPTPRGVASTGPVTQLAAAVFIDARGFDRWSFVDLLAPHLQGHFSPRNRKAVEAAIDDSLMVAGSFPTGLHLPMAASRQGPAASNLMALGWVSDRILRRYVPAVVAFPSTSSADPSRP